MRLYEVWLTVAAPTDSSEDVRAAIVRAVSETAGVSDIIDIEVEKAPEEDDDE